MKVSLYSSNLLITPKSLPRKYPETQEYPNTHSISHWSDDVITCHIVPGKFTEHSWDNKSEKINNVLVLMWNYIWPYKEPWKSCRDPARPPRQHNPRGPKTTLWETLTYYFEGITRVLNYALSQLYIFSICFRLKGNWNDEWDLLQDFIKCFQ